MLSSIELHKYRTTTQRWAGILRVRRRRKSCKKFLPEFFPPTGFLVGGGNNTMAQATEMKASGVKFLLLKNFSLHGSRLLAFRREDESCENWIPFLLLLHVEGTLVGELKARLCSDTRSDGGEKGLNLELSHLFSWTQKLNFKNIDFCLFKSLATNNSSF